MKESDDRKLISVVSQPERSKGFFSERRLRATSQRSNDRSKHNPVSRLTRSEQVHQPQQPNLAYYWKI